MRSERINFLAVVTAAAGLISFIGVFAKWFSYSYPVDGGVITLYLDGTWDATGAIVVAAGLGALAFGCAYILLSDPAIRRIVALLMVICSFMLVVSSIIGYTRLDEVIGPSPFLPGATGTTEFTATVAIGLGISLVSGLLAMVASVLLVARREEGLDDVDTPANTTTTV